MPTLQRLTIPYGRQQGVTFEVPAANLLAVLVPREYPAVADIPTEVRRALDHPIDSAPLRELVRDKRNVVILADDITRLTPTHAILPTLLDEINAGGVRDEQITLLIALGTHRFMTDSEILSKYGPEVVRRVHIINHDFRDRANLVDLGTTPNGTPIWINRLVCEADFCIGVGSVYPHHLLGFAGGAKIVQPGVSGADTTGATHLLGCRARPSYLGRIESPVRREMEAVARSARVNTILNVVQNEQGQTVHAVYGDLQTAYRAAAEVSRAALAAPFSAQADIVVAGSFPADLEFWQAHKTLYPAELAAKRGGTLIIVTPCPEGVSMMHPEMLEYTAWSPQEIDAAIVAGRIPDVAAGAVAIAWAHVRQGRQVSIVSGGLSEQDARALGFVPFLSVQDALADAFHRHGPAATLTLVPRAPETLPIMQ